MRAIVIIVRQPTSSMSKTIRVLPVKVDGVVVQHKEQLKDYLINKRPKRTLYSIYCYMMRQHDDRNFADYVDAYCAHFGHVNPFKIEPVNTASRQWQDLVKKCVTDDDAEAVIRNVVSVAMSDSKMSVKAAEVLANWMGVTKKVEVDAAVDANVDAKVSVNPELFELPDASE